MLALLNESISNASFGIYMPKWSGTIYELLSAPVSFIEVVIGYVGATGLATGPHLDCRGRRNGAWVNPVTEAFPRAERLLNTSMKAVGEAMSIGRNFKEALQKVRAV